MAFSEKLNFICLHLSAHVCFRNRIANRWSNQKWFTQKASMFALRTFLDQIGSKLNKLDFSLLKETNRFWFKPCPTAKLFLQEAVSAKFVIKDSNNIWRSINNSYMSCSPHSSTGLLLNAEDVWFFCYLSLKFIPPLNIWKIIIDLRLFSKFFVTTLKM